MSPPEYGEREEWNEEEEAPSETDDVPNADPSDWTNDSADRDEPASDHLDEGTRTRLVDAATDLRERLPPDRWEGSDRAGRAEMLGDVQGSVCRGLDTDATQLSIDEDLQPNQDGWSNSDTGEVGINHRLLDEADPTETIKTIAHEYRHNWQQEVIRGEIEHPLGPEAREELIEADRNYERDREDLVSYMNNPLEKDAEAVAELFVRAYQRRR